MQPIRQIQNRRNDLANEVTINRTVLDRLQSLANEVTIGARSPIALEIQKITHSIEVLEGKIEAIDFCVAARTTIDAGIALPEMARVEHVMPEIRKGRELPVSYHEASGNINVQATVRNIVKRYYKTPGTIIPFDEIVALFRSNGVYTTKSGKDIKGLIRVALNNMSYTPDLEKVLLDKADKTLYVYRTA